MAVMKSGNQNDIKDLEDGVYFKKLWDRKSDHGSLDSMGTYLIGVTNA